MLTKDNNKTLFKNPKLEKKEKQIISSSQNNVVDHSDCIIEMERLYKKIENKDKDYIILNRKYMKLQSNIKTNYETNKILQDENILLKKQNSELKILLNKDDFINDDLMYIDFDIFNESHYELERQINYYENQIDILNIFLKNNNINSFEELKTNIFTSILKKNDYDYIYRKYDNINTILENVYINFESQNIKMNELLNNYKKLDNRIKNFKNKLKVIPIGTIITINGKQKIFKGKIEKPIDKIKEMEQEFNNYCEEQISWAKSIIGDNYSNDEIIKLLDIYNKLNKNIIKDSSDSECELDIIINKYNMKSKKIEEYKFLSELGNSFIDNNINDKSQIKNFIKNNKEIIYSYDTKDKINRFISTCKRVHILSHIIPIDNIVKNKCQTNIRDITNIQFDNLIKLLENKNEKQ